MLVASSQAMAHSWFTSNLTKKRENIHFYASNFEEVAGAYWFRVVRPCVSVHQKPCMLGF